MAQADPLKTGDFCDNFLFWDLHLQSLGLDRYAFHHAVCCDQWRTELISIDDVQSYIYYIQHYVLALQLISASQEADYLPFLCDNFHEDGLKGIGMDGSAIKRIICLAATDLGSTYPSVLKKLPACSHHTPPWRLTSTDSILPSIVPRQDPNVLCQALVNQCVWDHPGPNAEWNCLVGVCRSNGMCLQDWDPCYGPGIIPRDLQDDCDATLDRCYQEVWDCMHGGIGALGPCREKTCTNCPICPQCGFVCH